MADLVNYTYTRNHLFSGMVGIINGSKKMISIGRSFYVSIVPKNMYMYFSAVLLSHPLMKNDFEGWFESYKTFIEIVYSMHHR